MDNLRKSSDGTAIELWTESAYQLLEVASKENIHPRSLKRALIGSVWGLANSAAAHFKNQWNGKPWVEKIEAADSDTQLKLLVRELSDEISEKLGNSSPYLLTREEIRQAVSYLESHFPERIAIADVASHVGLSEPYLCQVFKAETGMSILTMLNEIRMKKAYEMLASGNYLIKQASIGVGIPDPFYFNRLFRKRFGIAPKNIKKQLADPAKS